MWFEKEIVVFLYFSYQFRKNAGGVIRTLKSWNLLCIYKENRYYMIHYYIIVKFKVSTKSEAKLN